MIYDTLCSFIAKMFKRARLNFTLHVHRLSVTNYILTFYLNTATHLDIRDRAMGMQQAIQQQDPPNIPVENAQNDQQCPLLRLQTNLAL